MREVHASARSTRECAKYTRVREVHASARSTRECAKYTRVPAARDTRGERRERWCGWTVATTVVATTAVDTTLTTGLFHDLNSNTPLT